LNFCRPASNVPSSNFEWKDFDLAACAIEISGTLISEYLKGVREVRFSICTQRHSSFILQAYKRHPHTKEIDHEEAAKSIFNPEVEQHLSIALKVSLQVLRVFIMVSALSPFTVYCKFFTEY